MSDEAVSSGTREPLAGERIGDYEIEGLIARGGMASVFAVRDLRDGQSLALKLLLPRDRPGQSGEDGHGRFRREFRSLSRLQHPNVLRVFDSGMYLGRPWYSMERIHGYDLRAAADQLAELPTTEKYPRIESILLQVARALAYVHDRGLVHRDVTPANVMVLDDVEGEPTVKLMDFGVVKDTDPELTADGELVGTVAYMSPEQISGEAVDARADLYSLGAVLYLLLTGKRPFQAHTVHGYLEKHLHALPRPPHELAADVPPHLEEICLRLLAKAPADRFASATHLLYVLGDNEQNAELEGGWPPSTVGRTLLRARIRDAIDEVANGRTGQALLLSGAPGLGKTRILDVAARAARRRGLPVAMGRCRPQDRPFGAFASVFRALDDPSVPAVLRAAFGEVGEHTHTERYPVFAAFRDLIVARAPIVLVIDDLEDADPATVDLLVYLVRNTLELASEPVLFLLGHEAGSGERTRRLLSEVVPVYTVDLQPLQPLEVEELVVSVLGSDPASLALAERLFRDGSGSPAFIADMLRALIEDRIILRESSGRFRLTVDATQISQSRLPMPASLRQALHERLAPLSPDALAVGRVLALSRRRIELDVVARAAPIPEERVIAALDELIDARIVTEQRSAEVEVFELAHGRFREVLLDRIPEGELRPAHRALGESLERYYRQQIGTVVEELAYQFEQAQIWPKAYAYLVESAQRHLKRSLHHEALGRLERALAIEPQARVWLTLEEADRHLTDVWLATSRARYALGLSDGDRAVTPPGGLATSEAQRLARLVGDPRLEAQVATELGLQLRRQGRPEDAEVQLRTAIARAEASGDQTLLPPALYEVGVTRWSRGDLAEAEAHWRRALMVAQQVGDERSLAQGYNGLAILASCRGQPVEARRLLEQSAAVFERLGMLGHLVVTWSNLIELYSSTGVLRKAQSFADRMLSQAQEVSLVEGVVLGYTWRGRIMLQLGRAEEAERDADAAVRLLPRLANREDEPTVLGTAVMTALAREDAPLVLERVAPLLLSLDSYDPERILSEARAWRIWALARRGQSDDAARELDAVQIRPEMWPHVQVRTDLALGMALRELGRRDPAREVFQRALALSEANGFRWYQLLAHLELVKVAEEVLVRDRHHRVAAGIARSLAANLPTEDAERFLASRGIEPV